MKYKKTQKNLSVLIFLMAFSYLFAFSVIAQINDQVRLFVSPPTFELELEPGENYQNEIYLLNKSNSALPIKAAVTNFTATDEIGGMGFEAGGENIADNSRKWFKIEKPDFILEPQQSERVKFSINVPKDVTQGGYYSVIIFKSKPLPHYFEEGETKVLSQVGVLFLISIGKKGEADFEIIGANVSEKVRIRFLETLATRNRHEIEHETDPKGEQVLYGASTKQEIIIANSAHIPFVFRVKNNDVYHIKPSGTLQIFGSGDKIVGKVEVKETTILPGKIRKFEVNFKPALFEKLDRYLPNFLAGFISENLFFGKYKVILKLHGSAEVEKEMELLIFPWKGIIILLLLVFSTLFIIIKFTKQIRNKAARNRHKKIVGKKKVSIDGIKK